MNLNGVWSQVLVTCPNYNLVQIVPSYILSQDSSNSSENSALSSTGENDENREDENNGKKSIQRVRYSKEEYRCTQCPYVCTTEKAFLRHLRGCESRDLQPLSCSICGKDRKDKDALSVHMNKHKKGKQFCCDLCRFTSLQLKKLIQHRRMHTGEKPHLCPFCSYRSSRRDNLRSHVRRVHKKTNLTCDTFAPRSMLLSARKLDS